MTVTIAIDAMGGDDAPEMVIAGTSLARTRHPDARFVLYGDEARLTPLLKARKELADRTEIVHADTIIANDEKPSSALRHGKQSSMRKAIEAVSEDKADFVISAGNTGALMLMATSVLKTLPGIDRPAIASFFPTMRGETVMLDLGANIECSAENLVQFALMGSIFARIALGVSNPKVGLLNIGAEEIKGRETIREAAQWLRKGTLPLDYHGFVEGDGIPKGEVDVIVTDGFTGNIALKTAEGTAKFISEMLREQVRSSWSAKLGFLIASSAFRKLKHRMDPRRYNGAMFLGLGGVCVKSHGGTDAFGFANAVGVGIDLAVHRFNDRIAAELSPLSEPPKNNTEAAE